MDQLFNDVSDEEIEILAAGIAEEPAGRISAEEDVMAAAETDATADDEAAAAEGTFNEQLTQLEGIVSQLEGGHLELEDSLERYGEGVQLIRSLQDKLVAAEQKVQLMMGEIHEQE